MSRPVFVVGFMASGKTSLGKKLANALKKTFVDLDREIERRIKMSISEFVLKEGWEELRTIEHDALISLDLEDKFVATGGGTPCYFDSIDYMKDRGTVIFFDIHEEILFSRLRSQEHRDRPLIATLSGEDLRDFIKTSLSQRRPIYEQAHLTFNPVKQSVEEMATTINSYAVSIAEPHQQ